MKLIIIESPYRAPTGALFERNLLYLDMCIRDSILRGESPFASHKLYPGALNEEEPTERDLGIRCGYEWWRAASLVAFYLDLGASEGMMLAMKRAQTMNIKTENRRIINENRPNSNT